MIQYKKGSPKELKFETSGIEDLKQPQVTMNVDLGNGKQKSFVGKVDGANVLMAVELEDVPTGMYNFEVVAFDKILGYYTVGHSDMIEVTEALYAPAKTKAKKPKATAKKKRLIQSRIRLRDEYKDPVYTQYIKKTKPLTAVETSTSSDVAAVDGRAASASRLLNAETSAALLDATQAGDLDTAIGLSRIGQNIWKRYYPSAAMVEAFDIEDLTDFIMDLPLSGFGDQQQVLIQLDNFMQDLINVGQEQETSEGKLKTKKSSAAERRYAQKYYKRNKQKVLLKHKSVKEKQRKLKAERMKSSNRTATGRVIKQYWTKDHVTEVFYVGNENEFQIYTIGEGPTSGSGLPQFDDYLKEEQAND